MPKGGVPFTYEKRMASFWRKVEKCAHGPYCFYCDWLWKGNAKSNGNPIPVFYGVFQVDFDPETKKKTMEYTHRISWMLHNKRSLPQADKAQHIRHLCHVPLCVNPWHLTLGTVTENIHDMQDSGRFSQGERHYAAKLDEPTVLKIRELHKQGWAIESIQVKIDRSISTWVLTDVCHYRTWKHLP